MKEIKCSMGGACFARGRKDGCTILNRPVTGSCPFQKPEREYTGGKFYPMDWKYAEHMEGRLKA